jgi:hypothetical protein
LEKASAISSLEPEKLLEMLLVPVWDTASRMEPLPPAATVPRFHMTTAPAWLLGGGTALI